MEESEIVEKHDSFLEKHPNGNISKKSFDQLLSECLTKSSRKKLRGHLWRIYDLNMDGVVDFKEFMVVLQVMSDGSAEENLKQIFRFFDINLNGFIDKLELDRVVRDLLAVDQSNHNSPLIAEKAWEEQCGAVHHGLPRQQGEHGQDHHEGHQSIFRRLTVTQPGT